MQKELKQLQFQLKYLEELQAFVERLSRTLFFRWPRKLQDCRRGVQNRQGSNIPRQLQVQRR